MLVAVVYQNGWEFEKDLFLFDTSVFPFCYSKNLSLRKAISVTKKEQPVYFEILRRLSKDAAGKMYIKGAFANPTVFAKTIDKKYEGKSIERIAEAHNWL